MRRRQFMTLAALASLAGAARGAGAQETAASGAATPGSAAGGAAIDDIDEYFLQSGNLDEAEQRRIQEYEGFLDVQQRGGEGIAPRGGRPKWAPTYRLLHWPGEPGDEGVELVGPLGVEPVLPDGRAYRLNAQVLDFHTSPKRWDRGAQGTLTVEFRARQGGEALTWLFAEQFNCFGQSTSLGNRYIAERNNLPEPVILDEPNVDIRVQLMRHRKGPGLLRKILNLASFIVGGGTTGIVRELIPSVRVPQLVDEGVALTQAVFGGMSDEKPQWLSGFNSYGLSPGGSRLSLAPGFWVVLDEVTGHDLRDLKLAAVGDRMMLLDGETPIDSTYLVFWVEIESGSMGRDAGIVPKGG